MTAALPRQNSAEILADEALTFQHSILFGGRRSQNKDKRLSLQKPGSRYGRFFPTRVGKRLSAIHRLIAAWRPAILFAFAHAVALLAISGTASAVDAPEGTVKAQYGDWQVVCKDPPPGAKNGVCALVQSVTAEDKNNIGLTVYFQKFSNGTQVLRVFAPLGVLLPPGLGLKIDDKDVGHAPFLRCHSFACYAQVVVEDPLIQQLKTGKTAIFIIFQTEEAGIGIPISLKGFADGLKDLK
jgi:invasion protein IalB